MPYSNAKAPVAAFLSIKKKKGLAAAKAFGRKHRGEIAAAMKGNKNHSKSGYKTRSARGK